MMPLSFFTRALTIGILIGVLVCSNMFVAEVIEYPFPEQTVAEMRTFVGAVVTSVGEFRPILADYCVLMADHMWHEGRWYMVPRIYELLVAIQPSYVEFWALLGWFYAFNTTANLDAEEEKNEAIATGIAHLREGLRYHDAAYQLHFELAWIYYKKLRDISHARQYAYQAVKYAHPFRAAKLAAVLAYRTGDRKNAVGIWERFVEMHPDNDVAQNELRRVRASA